MKKITVTITEAEVSELAASDTGWPGMTFERAVVTLMERKGLRLNSSFSDSPDRLAPPWKAVYEPHQGAWTITQGDEE